MRFDKLKMALGLGVFLFGCASPAQYADYDSGGDMSRQAYGPPMEEPAGAVEYAMDDDGDDWEDEDAWDEAPAMDKGIVSSPVGGKRPEPKPDPSRDANAPKTTGEPAAQRIILYEAQIGLSVFKVEETLEEAVAMNKKLGGWVQASTSTSVTLRVPAKEFETLVEALGDLGDVTYRNVMGTDVTEEYMDLGIRLRNARVLRDRLAELLGQARTVEDSLAVERELARVNEIIERLEGRMRYLKDRAQFSIIVLNCQAKTVEPVAYSRIRLPFDWLRAYSLEQVLR